MQTNVGPLTKRRIEDRENSQNSEAGYTHNTGLALKIYSGKPKTNKSQ